MLSLTSFLGLLPGIRPLKARQLVLNGPLLDPAQREDIHERESFLDIVFEVGPDAASAILRAYKRGELPMQRASTAPALAPDADAYIAKDLELRTEIAERRRLKEAVTDPSLLVEADLNNYRLLDSIFFMHNGEGEGTLVLAGLPVTKTLTSSSSNSGKSRGWSVMFSWIGTDGKPRSTAKTSPQAGSRRNDPRRNWGVYE